MIVGYLSAVFSVFWAFPERASWVTNTLTFFPQIVVLMLGTLRRSAFTRETKLLGLGIALIALGDLLWAWHGFLSGQVFAAGVASGPFWLLGHVLVAGASASLAWKCHGKAQWVLLLDCLLATGVLTFFLWKQQESTAHTYLMPSLWEAIGFYGAGIAEILWLLAGLALLTTCSRTERGFCYIGVGVLVTALFDNLFALDVSAQLRPALFYILGSCLGYLILARGISELPLQREIPPIRPAQKRVLPRSFIPYIATVAFCGAMVLHSWFRQRHVHWELEAGLVSLSALLFGRLLVLMFENRRLARDLHKSHELLEETVARRTHQLTLLHDYVLALGDAAQEEELWQTALDYGRRLLDPVTLTFSAAEATEPIQHLVLVEDEGVRFGDLVASRSHASFSRTDIELLENLARSLATSLTRTRAFAVAQEKADKDPMTGLLNHRAALERISLGLEHARLDNTSFAVLMLDANNFKLFNDTYGHLVGDEVLRLIAGVLRDVSPEDAIVARYGGDEFVLGIYGAQKELLSQISTQINGRIHQVPLPISSEKESIPVSVSCGYALFPEEAERVNDLIALADRRLFEAKDRGEVITTSHRPPLRLATAETDPGIMAALQAMLTAVDNKDRYTRTHSEDVTAYALWLAEGLGIPNDQLKALRLAAMLHDIGKIGIPDDILRKPGHLTEPEFETMKTHTTMGALIVAAMPGLETTVAVVRSHHERWDGKGYPDGTQYEETPLLARIVAVADAFSAMTTSRPYRRARDWDSALAEIYKGAGTQFDPTLARVFVTVMRKYLKEEDARRLALRHSTLEPALEGLDPARRAA